MGNAMNVKAQQRPKRIRKSKEKRQNWLRQRKVQRRKVKKSSEWLKVRMKVHRKVTVIVTADRRHRVDRHREVIRILILDRAQALIKSVLMNMNMNEMK